MQRGSRIRLMLKATGWLVTWLLEKLKMSGNILCLLKETRYFRDEGHSDTQQRENDVVTVDIDSTDRGKKLLKVLRLLGVGGWYRVSSSGKGYHFVIRTTQKTDKNTKLVMRWMLGDDIGRMKADYRRFCADVETFGKLFWYRKGKYAGRWRDI